MAMNCGKLQSEKRSVFARTPVREALRQLELEGLVTIIPNQAVLIVNGISEQDVQDIYLIRARLEGLCARMGGRADR